MFGTLLQWLRSVRSGSPGWRPRDRGGATSASASQVEPSPVEIVEGPHTFPGTPSVESTVFTTWGLLERGHPELAFIVRNASDRDARAVRALLSELTEPIDSGHRVSPGEFTVFIDLRAFDRLDVAALGYARLDRLGLDGLLESRRLRLEDALCAVPLSHSEFDVAKDFGLARVLARLAHAAGFFPYPPWIDLDRASVIDPQERGASFLEMVGGARHTEGLSAILDEGVLRVKCPTACRSSWTQALDENRVLAVATDYDAKHFDASLVWLPRAAGPVAVRMPPAPTDESLRSAARMNGNFPLHRGEHRERRPSPRGWFRHHARSSGLVRPSGVSGPGARVLADRQRQLPGLSTLLGLDPRSRIPGSAESFDRQRGAQASASMASLISQSRSAASSLQAWASTPLKRPIGLDGSVGAATSQSSQ